MPTNHASPRGDGAVVDSDADTLAVWGWQQRGHGGGDVVAPEPYVRRRFFASVLQEECVTQRLCARLGPEPALLLGPALGVQQLLNPVDTEPVALGLDDSLE